MFGCCMDRDPDGIEVIFDAVESEEAENARLKEAAKKKRKAARLKAATDPISALPTSASMPVSPWASGGGGAAEEGSVGVFGVDVDKHGHLVDVLREALHWFSPVHLQSEGLWRTCGSKVQISKLQEETDRTGRFPVESIEHCEVLVGVLVRHS